MLLMDRIAENARLVLKYGAAPQQEFLRRAIAVDSGIPNPTQEDINREAMRGVKRILGDLDGAPRFVVERSLTTMMESILGHPGRLMASARHMFAPAEKFWVEIDAGVRYGFLVRCAPDTLSAGAAAIYVPVDADQTQHIAVPVDFDLSDTRRMMRFLGGDQNARFITAAIEEQAGKPFAIDLEQAGLLFLAILSVLCTPRLWITRNIDRERLNRRRLARGRWPLLAYHEVVIDPSHPPPTVSPADGHSSPRALHFVRAHLRLRLGRVELVRPHWRGDAQLGVRRPAYVMRNTN